MTEPRISDQLETIQAQIDTLLKLPQPLAEQLGLSACIAAKRRLEKYIGVNSDNRQRRNDKD